MSLLTKPIIFNTEMVQAILNGRKNTFRIPIESKKIKSETIVNYHHSEFTTFDTSYHSRFTINHYFKKGDTVLIKEKRKDKKLFVVIKTIKVERLMAMSGEDVFAEGFPRDKDDLFKWMRELWNSTAKKGYKWEDNPYVFVYEFERLNQ